MGFGWGTLSQASNTIRGRLHGRDVCITSTQVPRFSNRLPNATLYMHGGIWNANMMRVHISSHGNADDVVNMR